MLTALIQSLPKPKHDTNSQFRIFNCANRDMLIIDKHFALTTMEAIEEPQESPNFSEAAIH